MRLLARRMPLFFAALVLTLALATGGTALAGSAGDASTPAADAAAKKKKGKKKGCKKAKKKGAKGKSKRSASDAAKKRGKKGKKKGCKKGKKKGKTKGKDERKSLGEQKRDKRLKPDANDAKCKQAEAERSKAVAEHNANVAAANEDGTVDEAEKAELQKSFAAMQDAMADVRKYC